MDGPQLPSSSGDRAKWVQAMTQYDYDVVVWDTVGGAYTSESMNKASGGSEKEVVQLAEGLAKKGFRVLCLNGIERRAHAEMGVVDKRDGKNVDTRGSVTWDNANSAKNIRCKTLVVQRYSRLPLQMEVLADRMVVRATDVYGDYYKNSALTHLCVSEWQAAAFRAAAIPCVVIPAMLDDDYYELAATTKIRGRFIYASAYMKGLKETLAKWKELRHRFSSEMRSCTLFITSPGYGKLKESPCDFLPGDENVVILHDLPPRELAKYMATCEGLFYVCDFAESFCAVAAIANAVGCRVHVLEKHGCLSGVQEATNGFITERDDVFDDCFLLGLREELKATASNDFRVSTVMPQWLAALHLEGVREEAKNAWRDWDDEERAREMETFVVPDPTKKNVGSYVIVGQPEIHDVQDIIKKMETKTPTVCLVMLAKNAESTIKRALESVVGFVNYAVFQFNDEASSEKMRAIIHDAVEFPGFFTYVPWVNFSVNRNKLLDEARNFFNSTYVLTLDADDEFAFGAFDKSQLTLDSYSVPIRDGSTQYERLMIWRADKGYHYKGVAHEYLTSDQGNLTTATLGGVLYIRHGANLPPEAHRAKYLRDVKLFVKELREHPEDTRSTYYLGQSLEDASCGTDEELLRQALRVYETRAKMGGFDQEKFLAWLKIGRLRRRFKMAESAIVEAFQAAASVIPERAPEADFEIMHYYNNEGGSKEKAVAAGKKHAENFEKIPSGFVVDVSIYQWQFAFQYAIALCYTGDKKYAKIVFEALLASAQTPKEQHAVLRSNLQFCEPAVAVETSVLDELEESYGDTEPRVMTVAPRDSKPVPWFTPKEQE